MNRGMEVLSPLSYSPPSIWLMNEKKCDKWTHRENKLFESALAIFDTDTKDRWQNVAAMIPGKTVYDVMWHYKELVDDVRNIEAGLVPIPGYNSEPATPSSFMLEWDNSNRTFDGTKQSYISKKLSAKTSSDQERRKGIPWTEEEHRLFLMGLKKYGKGYWRNISRNFVVSKTPAQVASHAQKYFIRLNSGGKDKKRSSIHDITTASITGDKQPSPAHVVRVSSPQLNTIRIGRISPPSFAGSFVSNHSVEGSGALLKNRGSQRDVDVDAVYGTRRNISEVEVKREMESSSVGFHVQIPHLCA